MNYLSVESVSKRFGERLLFSDVTFGADKGQKLALIAKNGEGKTTLLEMLTAKQSPDSGSVTWRKEIVVGYLEQQEDFSAYDSITTLFKNTENKYTKAIHLYQEALDQSHNTNLLDKAIKSMDATSAWNYDEKVDELLTIFNLDKISKHASLELLSGGQKKRLSLVKLLLLEPDFYILDEPTNHLDVGMIDWLEDYFVSEDKTLLMVTHDRFFLNTICNQIIELDHAQIFSYSGNYEYYLEKKTAQEEIRLSEIGKAKNLYRKEIEWMRRMPKARGTKAKSRIDAFYETESKAKQNVKKEALKLSVKSERLGTKIIEIHHLSKRFGDLKIIDDFSYVFKRFERIGVVGKNGVGKSTLLNLLQGLEKADSGKIIVGETVKIAYYSQDGISVDDDKRIIDVVKDIAEVIPLEKGRKITASQLLEKFLFPPKQQYSYVSKLSGGEKKRLYLLTLLMSNPNFLILDEPTNDLDIKTIAILEDFLESFQGCLLIVSHDRAFMDRLAQHLFWMKGEGIIKDFNGKFSELVQLQKQEESIAEKARTANNVEQKQSVSDAKLSYDERKEYNKLEREIEKLEEQKSKLNELIFNGDLEFSELTTKSEELRQLEHAIEEKTDRWLTLSERA